MREWIFPEFPGIGGYMLTHGWGKVQMVIAGVFAMGVAAFVVHGGDPWTMGEGAKLFLAGKGKSWASREPALLYLVPFLALVFTGSGRFSIDRMIRPRR